MSIARDSWESLPRLARRLDTDARPIRQCVYFVSMLSCWLPAFLVIPAVSGDWAGSSEVLGWPLLAVADYKLVGLMPVLVSDAPSGWISIGIRPTGVIAMGVQPTGVFAVGLAPIGVFTLGLVALGLWSFGGVCAGFVSLGIVSAGWMSIGGRLSLGWYALADLTAIGVYAWGDRVRGRRFERARSRELLEAQMRQIDLARK